MSRPRALVLLLAVAAHSSCRAPLPDQVTEGRWVRYHWWADEEAPCPEAIAEIDHLLDGLATRFGRPLPARFRLDYYRLRTVEDLHRIPECDVPRAGACAVGNEVFALTPTQDHEVVHVFMNQLGAPPQLFMEGIAVVFGCGAARFAGDPLTAVDLLPLTQRFSWSGDPWTTYQEAADFTRFLIDEHGLEAFTGFYETTPHTAEGAKLDEAFRAAFGEGLEDALGRWSARPPGREGESCLALEDQCDGPTA